MSNAHARDPYDELDALVREAMGLDAEGAPDEPAHVLSATTQPDPFAKYDGKVVSLLGRLSDAALLGFSRKPH